jgi:hypothetical protein
MPEAYSNNTGPSLTTIERPRCPKCQNRMMLARIMPGPPGFDLRNFECAKCVHHHDDGRDRPDEVEQGGLAGGRIEAAEIASAWPTP